MIMGLTGNYRALAVRAFRDRWVWLVLGIVLFVVSMVVAMTVHAAPEAIVADGPSNDALSDMIKTSGPAGGIVLILGYFLRTWQADIKSDIKKLSDRVDGAGIVDNSLKLEVNTLQGALQTLRAENLALVQRVNKIERRVSGTHRRMDDEG